MTQLFSIFVLRGGKQSFPSVATEAKPQNVGGNFRTLQKRQIYKC